MKKATYKLKSDNRVTIEVELAKKDTIIKTKYGDALITAGNYVVKHTDKDRLGTTFGITDQDLNLLYEKV